MQSLAWQRVYNKYVHVYHPCKFIGRRRLDSGAATGNSQEIEKKTLSGHQRQSPNRMYAQPCVVSVIVRACPSEVDEDLAAESEAQLGIAMSCCNTL